MPTVAMTQADCDEADARAFAACLLYRASDTRRFNTYLDFLRDEKQLEHFSARAPWWDRFAVIAQSLAWIDAPVGTDMRT